MKTFVSYVIQDSHGHKHASEILTTQNPPYNFTADPQVNIVMDWAENKRKELNIEQELIVVSMYKL